MSPLFPDNKMDALGLDLYFSLFAYVDIKPDKAPSSGSLPLMPTTAGAQVAQSWGGRNLSHASQGGG